MPIDTDKLTGSQEAKDRKNMFIGLAFFIGVFGLCSIAGFCFGYGKGKRSIQRQAIENDAGIVFSIVKILMTPFFLKFQTVRHGRGI